MCHGEGRVQTRKTSQASQLSFEEVPGKNSKTGEHQEAAIHYPEIPREFKSKYEHVLYSSCLLPSNTYSWINLQISLLASGNLAAIQP